MQLNLARCGLKAHPLMSSIAKGFVFRLSTAAQGQLGPLKNLRFSVEGKFTSFRKIHNQRPIFT